MNDGGSGRPAAPVLYSFRRCPYAMRARLALLQGGKRVELREVVLRDKPAHMLALSPKATVPVLWLPDGRVIEESLDIMYWALPEAANRQSHTERDLVEQNDTGFKHHLDRYKYSSRFSNADRIAHRDACVALLNGVEARLADTDGGWLAGNAPGIADMAILPFVRQFRIAGEYWFDSNTTLPLMRSWLARFLAWGAFQAAMRKYEPWQPGTAGIAFEPVS